MPRLKHAKAAAFIFRCCFVSRRERRFASAMRCFRAATYCCCIIFAAYDYFYVYFDFMLVFAAADAAAPMPRCLLYFESALCAVTTFNTTNRIQEHPSATLNFVSNMLIYRRFFSAQLLILHIRRAIMYLLLFCCHLGARFS